LPDALAFGPFLSPSDLAPSPLLQPCETRQSATAVSTPNSNKMRLRMEVSFVGFPKLRATGGGEATQARQAEPPPSFPGLRNCVNWTRDQARATAKSCGRGL